MNDASLQIRTILEDNKGAIAEKVVEMQYGLYPEYWEKFGPEGKKLSIRDAGYHLPFLSEAIVSEDPDIFTDYVGWVKQLFKGLGFSDEVMINTLECTREVLKEYLDQYLHQTVAGYIDMGIREMHKPVKELLSYLDEKTPLGKLAKDFNKTLLEGNRKQAGQMIMDEVKKGTPIADIYLQVFQNSQLEVGRLWLNNEISVAQEHFVSAATQMIMSLLYPYIFSTERKGLTFVAACVGGELHEIGIRMVGDFFEMDGWDTYYLGANTPTSSILQAVNDNHARVLGLSIAMPYHRREVREVIERIKKDERGKELWILVGGNGINHKEDLWKIFGAHGYAPNAQKAVELANQLVNR